MNVEESTILENFEKNIESLLKENQYSTALQMAKQVIGVDEYHAQANYVIGYIYTKHDKLVKATPYLEIASKRNHTSAQKLLANIQKQNPQLKARTQHFVANHAQLQSIERWIEQLAYPEQKQQAMTSLTHAGKTAIPALLDALSDQVRVKDVQHLLLSLNKAAIAPLVRYIEQQEPQSTSWHNADFVLAKIYNAPTQQEVNTLKSFNKRSIWWFIVPLMIFLGISFFNSSNIEDGGMTSIVILSTLLAYLFWCGYWYWRRKVRVFAGIVFVIMMFHSPLIAYNYYKQSKEAQKKRAEYTQRYAKLVNQVLSR